MRPVSASFLAALRRSHRSTARIVVLDPATFALRATLSGDAGYVLDGTVSMSSTRHIRRTCEVLIANPDGIWTPNEPTDLLAFGALIRIERGIYLDDSTVEYATLGHFLVGRPIAETDGASSTLRLQGEDRSKLLVRSRFTTPASYVAGTPIATIVREICTAAGLSATDSAGRDRYRFDDKGQTLTAARTFDEDVSRIDALADLVRDYGLVLYADADGYMVLTAPPDPLTATTVWTFVDGDEAIHTGMSTEWTDDRLYNHVLVSGESADPAVAPVRAERMDANPASPTFVNGPLGDRLYRYTSAMITTAGQAGIVADHLLRQVARIEETIRIPAVTNPALEPGDAIAIGGPTESSGANQQRRYLVDDLTVPLLLGEQAIGATIIRPYS